MRPGSKYSSSQDNSQDSERRFWTIIFSSLWRVTCSAASSATLRLQHLVQPPNNLWFLFVPFKDGSIWIWQHQADNSCFTVIFCESVTANATIRKLLETDPSCGVKHSGTSHHRLHSTEGLQITPVTTVYVKSAVFHKSASFQRRFQSVTGYMQILTPVATTRQQHCRHWQAGSHRHTHA